MYEKEANFFWVFSGNLSEFNCHLPLHLHDNLSIAVVMSISNKPVNESKGLCTVDIIQSMQQVVSAHLTTLQKALSLKIIFRGAVVKSFWSQSCCTCCPNVCLLQLRYSTCSRKKSEDSQEARIKMQKCAYEMVSLLVTYTVPGIVF